MLSGRRVGGASRRDLWLCGRYGQWVALCAPAFRPPRWKDRTVLGSKKQGLIHLRSLQHAPWLVQPHASLTTSSGCSLYKMYLVRFTHLSVSDPYSRSPG